MKMQPELAKAGPELAGRRILVVEDDFILAETVSEILESAGASVVGPVGWAEEALSLLDTNDQQLDAAVLDLNLHGEHSYRVADGLRERKIGFVFTTGYGGEALEPGYQSCPRCQKPFRGDVLIAMLSALI